MKSKIKYFLLFCSLLIAFWFMIRYEITASIYIDPYEPEINKVITDMDKPRVEV